MDVERSHNGRVLEFRSESGAPRFRFTGASTFAEYYSGDGYNLEIQTEGVINLRKPGGSELHEC